MFVCTKQVQCRARVGGGGGRGGGGGEGECKLNLRSRVIFISTEVQMEFISGWVALRVVRDVCVYVCMCFLYALSFCQSDWITLGIDELCF